jgi:hypothetical protein
MKTLNLTAALLVVLFSFNAHSTNYKFIQADSNFEEKICMLAASNNRLGLENALDLYTWGNRIVTERFAVNNIICNGMVMAHFAHKYDASNTFAYLNNLTDRKNKMTSTNPEAITNHSNEETKIITVSSSE